MSLRDHRSEYWSFWSEVAERNLIFPENMAAALIEEEGGGIGFGEHQRVCAIHTDTRYKHMHVAISKVHPVKLTCVEPYYDKLKLLEVCLELEKVYGLKPGIGLRQNIHRTSGIEVHRGLEFFTGDIRERYPFVGVLPKNP